MPIFANSTDIKKVISSPQEIDVAIIGSGPAGTMIAYELSEKGYNVTLIEAGNRLPDTKFDEFFEFEDAEASNVNFGMSWQLGGTSNLWAGRCAPMDAFDLSTAKGWPLTKSDLEPYYQRASILLNLNDWEKVSNIVPFPASNQNWQKLIKQHDWSVTRFQWSKPCFNAATFLEELSQKNDNFSILLNTRALKFDLRGKNKEVSSLNLVIGHEHQCEFKAKVYVLATGGIETPRILLNSNDLEKEGLGNRSGTLGRYFSTHPKGNVGTLHLTKPVRLNAPMFIDTKENGLNLRFGLGKNLTKAVDKKTLNHYVQFSPKFEKFGVNLLEHIQQSVLLKQSKSDREGAIGRLLHFVGSRVQYLSITAGRIFFNVIGKIGLLQYSTSIVTLRGFFDQYPNPDNKVSLCETTDEFGMPKAKISWVFGPKDKASVRAFLEDLKHDIEKIEIGKFNINLPDENLRLTGIHSHFLGTARMGNDPLTSVADADGKLHDCDNLYLAGSSLFPSYGYANPVLTICAISIRTAEKIENHLLNVR